MKVLIAGATGAVGRPMVRMLIEAGHEVAAITRGGADAVRALGATPIVADALDRDGLLAAVDGLAADAVVHQLTALKKIPTRESGMAATNELRIKGTTNLLAAARAVGARRFVSQSFFGGYGFVDHGAEPLTEDRPFGVTGPFAATLEGMRSGEEQIFTADGIEGISLRYGGFYGPGSIEGMVEGLRRRRVPVPRGGGGYAPVVYIDDAAAAAVAALDHGRGGQAYNVCEDTPVTWGEFVQEIAVVFRTPKPLALPSGVIRLAAPYGGTLLTRTSMRLSNAKAKEELGWRPTVSDFREGLVRTRAVLTT
jgi:nucleoside-diphosphate-sugar epimerase